MVQEIYQSQIHTQHASSGARLAPSWRRGKSGATPTTTASSSPISVTSSRARQYDLSFLPGHFEGRVLNESFTFGRIAASGGYDVFMEGPMRNAFSWGGYLFCAHVLLSCFLFSLKKQKDMSRTFCRTFQDVFRGPLMPADIIDLFREQGFEPKKKTAGEWSSTCPACGGTKQCSIWPARGEGQGYYWCRNAGPRGRHPVPA